MLSPAQCRARAAECLIASHRSSDPHGQQAWRRWSDLWTTWSESVRRLTDPNQVSCPFPRIIESSAVSAEVALVTDREAA